MAELGRIERPSLESYRGKRKLVLVPLLAMPPEDAADGVAIIGRYWEQVQTQVTSLEMGVGWVKHVYHETLPVGGDDGLRMLEASGSWGVTGWRRPSARRERCWRRRRTRRRCWRAWTCSGA